MMEQWSQVCMCVAFHRITSSRILRLVCSYHATLLYAMDASVATMYNYEFFGPKTFSPMSRGVVIVSKICVASSTSN